MLDTLLHVIGVDLRAQIVQIKAHIEAFKEQTKQEVRREVKDAAITAGLAFAAIVALAGSCGVALTALYMWVNIQSGPFAALAAVGGLTTLGAALLSALALLRMNHKVAVLAPAAAPSRPARNAAAFVPPPPADALPFDAVMRRAATHATSMTDVAIDAASDLVSTGSRSTLIGTLAVIALFGIVIGRRHGD